MQKYKSPTHKLLNIFRAGRDKWKSKAMEAKKKLKLKHNRICFLEKSKATYKEKNIALKQKVTELESEVSELNSRLSDQTKILSKKKDLTPTNDFNKNLFGHHYSLLHIALWISVVTKTSASMRCASGVLKIILDFLNLPIATPSWYTGRLWLMRLGYYMFHKPKEKAKDWILIIDHSVQIGQEKCLLILGVRQKNLPQDRPLRYNDLEPIDLVPVKKSNGEVVYEQLESTINKIGVPLEILSDAGSDIKTGVDEFCAKHLESCGIYDIKHKTASLLKRELSKDEQWDSFATLCSQTKCKLQQTQLAFIAPPNQRSKSRYMNLEILVKWGIRALKFIENERANPSGKFDLEKIESTLGWVVDYKGFINELAQLLELVGKVESKVRREGLSRELHINLEKELKGIELSDRNERLKLALLAFIYAECQKVKPEERLLGSSEIIESLFGKQKSLEGEQSKSGFTGLILCIAAYTSKLTQEEIKAAMEMVPTKKVKQWILEKLGETVQSTRKKVFTMLDKLGNKMEPILN